MEGNWRNTDDNEAYGSSVNGTQHKVVLSNNRQISKQQCLKHLNHETKTLKTRLFDVFIKMANCIWGYGWDLGNFGGMEGI